MAILAAFLLIAALFLFWQASRQRKASGLPAGRIIYSDTSQWGKVEKPLYDSMLNLTGKPDYLVEHGQFTIPVEVKSGRAPAEPYDTHIFQLAAYCRLVEHSMGKRPPYGILHYANQTFAIDYTPELESTLLDVLAQIRIQERHGEADRSHDQPGRCAHCGYRNHCDQRLV
jgi:CRISPR-associated exonuclease Cas4